MKFLPRVLFILIFSLSFVKFSFSQVELVDVSNPVYDYLKRMQLMKVIPGYNSSDIPLSRSEVASYLITISNSKSRLSSTDKKLLNEYETDFEYEIYGSTKRQVNIFGGNGLNNILNYNKVKHLYFYADSNKTFFGDLLASLSQRGSSGMYLYRISATGNGQNFVLTKKMMLVK